MAMFNDSPHFEVHDDYYTPKSAWAQINHLLPKDKVIWEACCLNSHQSLSPDNLEALGNNVVYDKKMDCLKNQPEEWDMIVTNPPYDKNIKIPVLKRFVKLDKPFILIMNITNTFTKYFREIFAGNLQHLQVITPDDKIHFARLNEDGSLSYKKNTSFYCCYVCYKCNIDTENLWITTPKKGKEINYTPDLNKMFRSPY